MSTTSHDAAPAGADEVELPRPLRRDAARNRQLLLDAAREVFARRGLEVSLDDVARHAGVGVGTAYRHFANKYDLARAVLAQAIEDVVDRFDAACRIEDPWVALTSVTENWACAQVQDRGLREALTGVHDDETVEYLHSRISGPLQGLLDRAKAAGVVRVDVEASDIGMISMMLCSVADVTADQDPELWRRYAPMLLAGLTSSVTPAHPALSDEEFRHGLAQHKRALRAAAPPNCAVVADDVLVAAPLNGRAASR